MPKMFKLMWQWIFLNAIHRLIFTCFFKHALRSSTGLMPFSCLDPTLLKVFNEELQKWGLIKALILINTKAQVSCYQTALQA